MTINVSAIYMTDGPDPDQFPPLEVSAKKKTGIKTNFRVSFHLVSRYSEQ